MFESHPELDGLEDIPDCQYHPKPWQSAICIAPLALTLILIPFII